MLMTEWSLEEAIAVQREEREREIAKKALNEGASVEFVQKITGLSIEDIERLAAE
jgi:predicted transposase YdaD